MVSAFHDAGLEVYLDVVYNHTAEGGNWNGDVDTTGFTSLGGFACAEYYEMTADKHPRRRRHRHVEPDELLLRGGPEAGAGLAGVLDAGHGASTASGSTWPPCSAACPTRRAADDWARQKRFFSDHPLLVDIAAMAKAEHIEVIAEAWDLWGYEVGNFPRGWGEWNGRYRDAVRRFTKGDANMVAFTDMFNGDYHHFHDSGGPQKTINFITAHDGFNMADLVSYQEKQNDQPPPFGPSDGGSDDNLSWDSGGSQALRRQRLRNLWTILFFSRGVPMIVAGDEFGRTQNGNNNPWALDSVAMRNNYAMIPTNAPQRVPVADGVDEPYHDNLGQYETPPHVNGQFRFATFLANLRQRHEALQQRRWGDMVADDKDVSYLFHTPSGEGFPMEGDRAVSIQIDSPGDDFWVMINMADHEIEFKVPPPLEGYVWRRLIDTSTFAEPACNYWNEGEGMIVSETATVAAWSVIVWQEQPKPDGSRVIPVWKN